MQPPTPPASVHSSDWASVPSPQESAPFAVIGSNTVVEAKGQRVRGRLYPWGIVEGELRPGALGMGREGSSGIPHPLCTPAPQWRIRHTATS